MTAGGGPGRRARDHHLSGHGGARRRRSSVIWLARVTVRRARAQWRLLAVAGVVALLVSTLVSTLTVLIDTTDRAAVRQTLATAPADRTDVVLQFEGPQVHADGVRQESDEVITRLLGVDMDATVQARTASLYAERPGRSRALVYLGELDRISDQAELVSGAWPEGASTTGPLPVALPLAGAEALDVEIGDTLSLQPVSRRDSAAVPDVRVIGFYTATGTTTPYWRPDVLSGAGYSPDAIVPGSAGYIRTDMVGPLVVAPGSLAARDVPLGHVHLRYSPDFAGSGVVELAALQGRLAVAATTVPRELETGGRIRLTTDLDRLVAEITSAVLVTRAGVAVAGLLLLLVAGTALLQVARLLADARSVEHDLMRARGSSSRQLLTVAGFESGGVAVLAALGGALLAPVTYRTLLTARGFDGVTTPDVSVTTWTAAAAVGLTLAAVLIGPLLRQPSTFVEGQQARGRDRRAMLARSGVDVLIVGLAAVAYWQLWTYAAPISGTGASMRIDPVLVAGPAVVLLAGALLCVRLLPPAARLAERMAGRGRGLVGPLAAWEIGRRPSRATGAVLLLTLALGLTSFSQAFLATWHRSQGDQAEFATGAPVRVLDESGATGHQVAALAAPEAGPAQPVIRASLQDGSVAEYDLLAAPGRLVNGRDAEIIALTPQARAMLNRGRMAEEGGAVIAAMPSGEVLERPGIELGEDVAGISLVMEAHMEEGSAPPAGVLLRLAVRDATGVYSVLHVGMVGIDGGPRRVDALLDGPNTGVGDDLLPVTDRQYPLEVVGFGAYLSTVEGAPLEGSDEPIRIAVQLSEIAALRPGEPPADAPTFAEELAAWDGTGVMPVEVPEGLVREPITPRPITDWSLSTVSAAALMIRDLPDGVLGFRILGSYLDLAFSPVFVGATAWSPQRVGTVVLTRELASRLDVAVGDRVQVMVRGGQLVAEVTGIVPRVPTTRSPEAAVVDYAGLARGLVEGAGSSGPDEWWVDVAPEDQVAYLAGLPDRPDGSPGASRATATVVAATELREHPYRVALPIALWLVIAGAALIAAVGFAVHAAVTVRSRETEFAQLRAVGLQRRPLAAVVAVESMLMSGFGVVFGVGLGAALGWLVGPLVAVSADGTRPVPDVVVEFPWLQVLAVVGGLLTLVAAVVVAVAWAQRSADPAGVLRSETAR